MCGRLQVTKFRVDRCGFSSSRISGCRWSLRRGFRRNRGGLNSAATVESVAARSSAVRGGRAEACIRLKCARRQLSSGDCELSAWDGGEWCRFGGRGMELMKWRPGCG